MDASDNSATLRPRRKRKAEDVALQEPLITETQPAKRKRNKMLGPIKRLKTTVTELSLCCWNVNGMRAILRKEALQSLLLAKSPDILCLSETLLQPCHVKEIEGQLPSTYFKYWALSEKKGYAGVCLLTKTEPLSVQIGLGIEKHDKEGRLITAEYDKYYVLAMYAPHLGNEERFTYRFQEWEVDILLYVKNLQRTKPVIWLGDFNIIHDSLDFHEGQKNKWPHTTAMENAHFRALLSDLNMVDSFRYLNPETAVYSYFDRRSGAKAKNKGWRIDFILVPEAYTGYLREASIMREVEGSDHVPCLATLSIG
mmetsp:Transcript_21460/g.39272  ORF Transcript_21460/g.39272 Transcript_21460/m.39272 type:complete len:311 (-) Transcript_21460:295-1227(-)